MKSQYEKDLEAVRLDGRALKDIKIQTHEIALAAVSINGRALEYVKEQTPEIALAAVTNNGYALKYVKDQTPEIVLAAISQNGCALQYAADESAEIALAAVYQNSLALRYVKNQTPEIVLEAVSQDGYLIVHAEKITKVVSLAAWNQVGDDLINYSAQYNLIDTIDLLISKKVPIDHISAEYPITPFQFAARYHNKEALLILSNHGANINIKNKFSKRNTLSDVIFHSCGGKLMEIELATISTLLEIGVSPTKKDKEGNTAFTLAKDKPEILSILNAFALKKIIKATISKSERPVTSTRKAF
jgi:ankyrin repeat protein